MKKYIVLLSLIYCVSIYSVGNRAPGDRDYVPSPEYQMLMESIRLIKPQVSKPSVQSRVLSCSAEVISFAYNQKDNKELAEKFPFKYDEKSAERYRRHAYFYATQAGDNRLFLKDGLIDHIIYPVVDMSVGKGMNLINVDTYLISDSNKKLIAENTQLIASAAIVNLARIHAKKGLQEIDRGDFKEFGKSCLFHASYDIADALVVKPIVKEMVGNNHPEDVVFFNWAGNLVVGAGIHYLISKL